MFEKPVHHSEKFVSWRLRREFIVGIINFLLGFFVAWIIAADTVRYILSLLYQ